VNQFRCLASLCPADPSTLGDLRQALDGLCEAADSLTHKQAECANGPQRLAGAVRSFADAFQRLGPEAVAAFNAWRPPESGGHQTRQLLASGFGPGPDMPAHVRLILTARGILSAPEWDAIQQQLARLRTDLLATLMNGGDRWREPLQLRDLLLDDRAKTARRGSAEVCFGGSVLLWQLFDYLASEYPTPHEYEVVLEAAGSTATRLGSLLCRLNRRIATLGLRAKNPKGRGCVLVDLANRVPQGNR
jgi:hypothetical protein